MKILFLHTPHPRLNLISQIQLEILFDHVKHDDEIFFLRCNDKTLGHCETNHKGVNYLCGSCKITQDKLLNILKTKGHLSELNYYTKETLLSIPSFSNVNELRNYKYKDVQLGIGIASSLISRLRDHEFDINENRVEIEKEVRLARQVLDTIIMHIEKIKPDIVYVFNGRLNAYAPVVSYCKMIGQPFKVYEFTSRQNAYHLVDNTIPHDVAYEEKDIERIWKEERDEQLKIKIGSEFFENTRKGVALLEQGFVSTQKNKDLSFLDNDKEKIIFFNSSIDEYASVPGWEKYIFLFDSEVDAIYEICKRFEHDATKQFVLRMHPNLKFIQNTQIKNLEKLNSLKNIFIIKADSDLSSYALVDIADKIITFGSTIAVEATYFNKPSIQLGLAFYGNLNATYIPKTKEELFELLAENELKVKPKINAIKYGFWWLSFGEKKTHLGKEYDVADLNFSYSERMRVLALKIFSIDFLRRTSRIFGNDFFRKLKDKRFRDALKHEIFPWIKN